MDMQKDQDQIRLLSIFHYVIAAITGLFSLFPVIHLVICIAIVSRVIEDLPKEKPEAPFPAQLTSWIFILFPAIMITMGLILSVCIGLAGMKLSKYRSHTFCMIVACVECLFMPFGTVLGILTIIALQKPSVKELFDQNSLSSTNV